MRFNKFILLTSVTIATIVSSVSFADRDDDDDERHHGYKIDSSGFSFALIGDGPYGEDQEPKYDNLIGDINDDRSVRFVIHAGDTKGGGEMCTDELITRRFEQLQKINRPFVYTPGDNEWTDCHRTSNGSYLPTERLAFVRELFFPKPRRTTGGRTMRVMTQADTEGYETFVENTLFARRGVIFSQIHVVGSNNNLRPWDQLPEGDRPEERLAEFEARNEASLAWLERTFEIAKRRRSPGIFITIHANLNFDIDRNDEGSRAGFNDFIDALSEKTLAYGKPVIIAHGDSHIFRVDMPRLVPWYRSGDATTAEDNVKIPNLTRVETFGHFDNHWVKVLVNPRSEAVFSFVPQIVESNL